MAVDFSNVRVGDRVKLSRENGDEYTFTVHSMHRRERCLTSRTDNVYEGEWDSLEVLAKPLPTVNGSVIRSNADGATFVLAAGSWLDVRNRDVLHNPVTTIGHWEILFEPGANN